MLHKTSTHQRYLTLSQGIVDSNKSLVHIKPLIRPRTVGTYNKEGHIFLNKVVHMQSCNVIKK